MKKLLLIVARECRMRFRRPSFWVLTLLVPLLLAALYALPVVAAHRAAEPTTVLVVDQTGLFADALPPTPTVDYRSMPSVDHALRQAADNTFVLYIPLRETTIPHDAFLLYQGATPSPEVRNTIEHHLQQLLRNAILEDVYHLEPSVYHSVEATHISLHTQDAATGRESYLAVKTVLALVLAALLVLAVVVFAGQTMRAIQEERQNRVAEIVATSVRPLQLLAGKMIGVATTAMLQLALWIALTATAIAGIQAAAPTLFDQAQARHEQRSFATKGEAATAQYDTPVALVDQTVEGLAAIRLPLVAGAFALLFLRAFLLYGSLIAAVATRLDTEAEPLQWTLLLASPLLLVLVLLPIALRQPAGALAMALTFVPFTAPAALIARLPFGLPAWQFAAGSILLALFALLAIVLAARTYRRNLIK